MAEYFSLFLGDSDIWVFIKQWPGKRRLRWRI